MIKDKLSKSLAKLQFNCFHCNSAENNKDLHLFQLHSKMSQHAPKSFYFPSAINAPTLRAPPLILEGESVTEQV